MLTIYIGSVNFAQDRAICGIAEGRESRHTRGSVAVSLAPALVEASPDPFQVPEENGEAMC